MKAQENDLLLHRRDQENMEEYDTNMEPNPIEK